MILDLMGHDIPIKGFEDLLFVTGMESHSQLESVIRETSSGNKIRVVPTLNRYVGDMSDHHIFRVNDIPYLFLSCGRWEHYHMPTDTPEKLNYEKMAAMADFLQKLIIKSSEVEFSEESPEYDSTATELLFLNTIFRELFRKYGIDELQSREDIDGAVRMLMGTFNL